MAKRVGQIVYNLHSYQQNGGLVSTSKASLPPSTVISSHNNSSYTTDQVDIYQDIVGLYGAGTQFTKLGIQCEPGTKFIVNDSKEMIVGRSGIYELDEDIVITKLRFKKPVKYEIDPQATADCLRNGSLAIDAAEGARTTAINNLNAEFPNFSDFLQVIENSRAVSSDGLKYIYDDSVFDQWGDETKYAPVFAGKEPGLVAGTFNLSKNTVDNAVRDLNTEYWDRYTNIQTTYQNAYNQAYNDLSLGLNGVYNAVSTQVDLYDVIIDFLY